MYLHYRAEDLGLFLHNWSRKMDFRTVLGKDRVYFTVECHFRIMYSFKNSKILVTIQYFDILS